jgi:hypothetical protein
MGTRAAVRAIMGRMDLKWFDTFNTKSDVQDGAPQSTAVSPLVAIGTSSNQRVGNKVWVHSIQIKIRVHPGSATPAAGCTARFVLVIDKQHNGAATVATFGGEVMDTTATAINVDQLRNLDTTHRFRILVDKIWIMGAQGEAESRFSYKYYKKFKKPLVVQYSGTGSALTDVETNLIVAYYGGTGTGANTGPNLHVSSRCRYHG